MTPPFTPSLSRGLRRPKTLRRTEPVEGRHRSQPPPDPEPFERASLTQVKALFTDVDGTLTLGGRIPSRVVAALESLAHARIPTVLVTGRSAGFGETWIRTLPVDAVITENGGVTFDRVAGTERVKRSYAVTDPAQRAKDRARLTREVKALLRAYPKLKLSSDSAYTEVDLAIDYHEEVRASPRVAEEVAARLHARGIQAVRSSVHVNCWIGAFDKATAVETWIRKALGTRLRTGHDGRFVYVGDSLNDAPLFARFSLSVGVANVREVLAELPAPPRYVTRRPGGFGFVEVANALLRAKKQGRR